jgi:hypothetical protein
MMQKLNKSKRYKISNLICFISLIGISLTSLSLGVIPTINENLNIESMSNLNLLAASAEFADNEERLSSMPAASTSIIDNLDLLVSGELLTKPIGDQQQDISNFLFMGDYTMPREFYLNGVVFAQIDAGPSVNNGGIISSISDLNSITGRNPFSQMPPIPEVASPAI